MKEERLVRTLIGVEIVLVLAGIASAFAFEGFLPQPLRDWIARESAGPADLLDLTVIALFALLSLATLLSWVAMLDLWRHGRALYLGTWVAWIGYDLLTGPTVMSPVESAIDTTLGLVGGMILGLAYFSNLKTRFEPTGAARAAQPAA